MTTTHYRMAELVHKHLCNSLSKSETFELDQILLDPQKKKLFDELTDLRQTKDQIKIMSEGDTKASWKIIKAAYSFPNQSLGKKYLASAVIVLSLVLGCVYYFYVRPKHLITSVMPPASAKSKITMHKKDVAVCEILLEASRQVDFNFCCDVNFTAFAKNVTIDVDNASLDDVLKLCSKNQVFTLTYKNDMVEWNCKEMDVAKSHKTVWRRKTGLSVYLDKLKNGIVGYMADKPVMKNDSELIFPAVQHNNLPIAETLETLGGGYYRLRLPDGSKVVLNSSSSLHFDSSFCYNRQVTLNGEGFFDVQVDQNRPFYVNLPGLKVEIWGAQCNIKAYKKEKFITCLTKGRVTIKTSKWMVDLKSGDQALFNYNDLEIYHLDEAFQNKVEGWRKGIFNFRDDNLKDILSELSRWYDLRVEYKDIIPESSYYGIFSRSDSIKSILEHLQSQTGFRYNLSRHGIIVQR